MNRHSQQGSALLIVLGFLSFMVVSAVAFAVWMRTERMPSSALRRNVANNYLVKAALAQAMSRVDDAIRSHPFPGAWNTNMQAMAYRDANNCAYDWWESRIFMPPDPDGEGTTSGDPYSRYAPVTKTVSVLNLEALGYLPPALVNDARLLSRSSWAAKWDYFNFDAGRYAFCAVNVSDMLDISKIAADSPRTSSAAVHPVSAGQKPPPSRFSLAYLFRNSTSAQSDNFSSASGMGQFDQRVHTAPGNGQWTTAPLVSLMDYNLSIGPDQVGPIWSPFFKQANGDNNSQYFYGASGSGNPYVKGAERQPFVTSSWFPPNEYAKSDGSASTPLDISHVKGAPFTQGALGNENATLMTVLGDTSPLEFWQATYQNDHAFCLLDQFTLFDYLDKNDVPLSLALPCAERVPMLTALAPVGAPQVEFVPAPTSPSEIVNVSETERKKYYDTKMKITLGGMGLNAVLAFPFSGGKQNVSCSAQAFARLVFVGEDAAGGAPVTLRSNGFAQNFRPLSEAEWTATVDDDKQFMLEAGSSQGVLSHTPAENCMVVTLPSQNSPSWTPPDNMQNESQCLKEFKGGEMLQLKGSGAPLERTIVRRVETYDVTPPTQTNPQGTETLRETKYQIVLRPFDRDGNVIDIPPDEMEKAAFDALCQQYTIRPYLVTWARVVQEGKTVDMVPATYEDDMAFNGINNAAAPDSPLINRPLGNTPPGSPAQHAMPIMRFPGKLSGDFTYTSAQSGQPSGPIEWTAKSCYAVDPRYNWAPENWWFDESDANLTGQKWYNAVFGNGPKDNNSILNKLVQDEFDGRVNDRGDRATDPFLFVSNLGYLQSVGELAFLPHLSNMKENGLPISVLGDTKTVVEGGGGTGALYDGNPRVMSTTAPDQSVLATMPCALAAWKSYQNFRTNPNPGTFEFGANLYRRGLANSSQGFYVNPFTESQEVMLAALANAPLNYWVAGTNYQAQGKTQMSTFDSYKSHMFGDSSSGVQFKGSDVNKVATFLRRRFEDLASMIKVPTAMGARDAYVYQKVWEDMFDALDWSGTLDCTVEDVYDALVNYYNTGGSNNEDYRQKYMEGNGYSALNRFALGGGKGLSTGIRLRKDKAVHKEDFGFKADPLRGQYKDNSGDTSCYNQFFDVDRKFLHSYWRDCFANRQQLFLIFVRAESTALGGSGEGTPAQQGGRAVALVWRDPAPPTGGYARENEDNVYYENRQPHKMRILFYRQFD